MGDFGGCHGLGGKVGGIVGRRTLWGLWMIRRHFVREGGGRGCRVNLEYSQNLAIVESRRCGESSVGVAPSRKSAGRVLVW